MSTLLRNCRLVSPGIDLLRADLVIENGTIAEISTSKRSGSFDQIIDAKGLTAAPGFIDIHAHGRSGADFCDGTEEAFHTIGRGKLCDGVTGFLATTLTLPWEELKQVARCAAQYAGKTDGAELLGLHLEGPFFNPACAGAQNPAYLRTPDIAPVEEIGRIFPVVKVSYSPELPGGAELTRALCERGIMPSGAHTAADYACFEEHRKLGMKHLTHFCNVMTPVHHLRFGMVGGALMADDVFVEMICDGVHLCDQMIRLIARLKGAERMMLITDAIRASAMPDGNYSLGGLPVVVRDGRAELENGTVAGSTLRYHNGLRKLIDVTGLPLCEAIRTTGWNQARTLGIKKRGKLEKDYFADIVLLDDELEPQKTILRGSIVWEK